MKNIIGGSSFNCLVDRVEYLWMKIRSSEKYVLREITFWMDGEMEIVERIVDRAGYYR